MPPLPPAPQALKCVYSGTFLSTDWANVFYVKYAGTEPTDADLATVATSLRGAWLSALAGALATSVSLTKTSVTDVSRNPGAYGENSTVASGSGGATAFPASVSVVISKKVARRYRGGHPRLYLPGIPTAASTDGRSIVAGSLTGFNSSAANWRTAVNAITTASTGALTLANVSYYHTPVTGQPPVPRPIPLVETVISCTVAQRLDSQRRRLD